MSNWTNVHAVDVFSHRNKSHYACCHVAYHIPKPGYSEEGFQSRCGVICRAWSSAVLQESLTQKDIESESPSNNLNRCLIDSSVYTASNLQASAHVTPETRKSEYRAFKMETGS